jgi:hypothetical protein
MKPESPDQPLQLLAADKLENIWRQYPFSPIQRSPTITAKTCN